MTEQLFQSFSTFAGRIAATDDPRAHQNAGLQLQRDLKRIKIESDKSNRPTDAATAQAHAAKPALPVAI